MMQKTSSAIGPRTSSIQYVPELDGIRGIAISLVLLFHLTAATLPLFRLGWCGVDLFFVLSGFLITSVLLASKGSGRYFRTFFARRVLRIFPLYYLVLFAVSCFGLPLAHLIGLARSTSAQGQIWYWLYLSNWWNGLGHNIYFLSHFWTLAVEEQFYLVWPLVVFLLNRRSLAYCCVGVAIVCPLLRTAFSVNPSVPELLHRATIFRIDSLALGGLVAVFVADPFLANRIRPYLQYAALLAAGILGTIMIVWGQSPVTRPMMTMGYTALAFASMFLVFHAATKSGTSGFLVRVLRLRPLRELGKYSYAIYVLHYPIVLLLLSVADRAALRFPGVDRSLFIISTVVLGFGISYVAALLSWNLVEKRFLGLKRWFTYPPPGRRLENSESQFMTVRLLGKSEVRSI